MMQLLMQKAVRSVINLIEQTQGTDLPSMAKTTKVYPHTYMHCIPLYPVNSNDTHTDDIHKGKQYSRLDKPYALNQLLSAREQSENFISRRTTRHSWLPATQFHANESGISIFFGKLVIM